MVIQNLSHIDLEALVKELKLDKSPFTQQLNANLVCSNQNHVFVYIEHIGAFLTIYLATSKQSQQAIADNTSVQYLNINSPPIGHLKKCLMSSDGTYILVVCDKSATVVELPSKWGKSDRYEGGKKSVICKSVKLNVSKNLDIIDGIWHSSNRDPNVVICLTSDSYLRFFKIGGFTLTAANSSWHHQFKEFHLDKTYSKTSLSRELTSKVFKTISIDIGARLKYCDKFAYPIFALKSNGQVECLIEYEQSNKFEYLGPLDLTPYCMDVEEDNQVRGFVCLRGAPNLLAILLSNGIVYHCLFMTNLKEAIRFYESENNFKEYYSQDVADVNLSGGEAILFVYESLRLLESDSNDFSAEFLRDPFNNWRYFLCHSNGVHSVSLPWFENIQEIYEKEESLHEFDESRLCEISQVVCTRPFQERPSNILLLGSTLFYNYAKGEQSLISLTNEPKLIDINITTRRTNDIENEDDQFVNYIVSLMKRDASMPYIKANFKDRSEPVNDNELKMLTNNAINLIKAEYIEKQRQVIAEFKKKCKQLKQQESLQFELIKETDARLDELKSRRVQLLANVERLFEHEQKLKKKMEDVLNQLFLRSSIPKSDVENEIHYDLRQKSKHLKDSINKVNEAKKIFVDDQQFNSSAINESVIKSKVDESDVKMIKSLLKNQSDKIKSLIQKVEIISQSMKSAV